MLCWAQGSPHTQNRGPAFKKGAAVLGVRAVLGAQGMECIMSKDMCWELNLGPRQRLPPRLGQERAWLPGGP